MLHDLDHVILAVRDLGAATREASILLGRSPSWRGIHPGEGTANTLFRLDNTSIELLSPEGDGPTGRAVAQWLDARGEGPLGLAFGTDDAEACREAFESAGLEPLPLDKGMGRDEDSGAFREWIRIPLPPALTRGVILFGIERTSPDEILPPAPPIGDPRAVVNALDHAVVQTTDAEATRALYGERLGLRLALDKEFPQWGARLMFFRVGGVTVEVAARIPGNENEAPPEFSGDGDRLWGLSYRVPDASAARARMADAGLDVSEVRTGRRPGTQVFTVRSGTLGVPTLILALEAD